MKKRIAVMLLAAAVLMLAACGSKAAAAPTAAETEQTQEAPTQETVQQQTEPAQSEPQDPALPMEIAYEGVYCQPWSEEIGGEVTERNAYIVLNEDHTGYWIVQGVASLVWDETQLTTAVGEVCGIALTQENGTVNLLVYPDPRFDDTQTPSVYEKIEKLPAELEAMIAEEAAPAYAEQDLPGVYCQTTSEEIGGTVTEKNAYIVLNEDHTGYWVAQEVGTVTWDVDGLTDNLGLSYRIALTQENGTVNLLVYPDPRFDDTQTPSVFEKIEELPTDIKNMISAS